MKKSLLKPKFPKPESVVGSESGEKKIYLFLSQANTHSKEFF